MAKGSKHTIYEFDEFSLDAGDLMLYRGDAEISLPIKVVETLLVLIEERGRIISKDELMERVWADNIVEESNLSQNLYRLRKLLGDQPDGRPFIETFRRRGYRFNGDVRVIETRAVVNQRVVTPTFARRESEIEQEGNVLKFVDRRPSEVPVAQAVPVEPQPAMPAGRPYGRAAKAFVASAGAVILLLVVFLGYQYLNSRAQVSDASREMTLVRLTNGSHPVDATISRRGDYFVYHEQDGDTAHVWLQQTGQSKRVEIASLDKKYLFGKTFSPDGQYVYFAALTKPDDPSGVLYRVPTLGGAASQVIENVNSTISFSPDGERFVFRRWNKAKREYSLVIADVASKGEEVLLIVPFDDGVLGYPAWSPDGNVIAFSRQSAGTTRINGLDLRSGAIAPLSSEPWDNCFRIEWMPDGDGMVFIGTKHREGTTTRRDQIYYLSTQTGLSRRLTTAGNRQQIDTLGVTEKGEIITLPYVRSSQIWATDASGSERSSVPLTAGSSDGRAGLEALNDGRIAYTARTGDSLSIWTVKTDGGEPSQLISDPPVVEEVRAAPNGSFLTFTVPDQVSDGHIFRVDPDGTNVRQLTFGERYDVESTISPDNIWVVFTSQWKEGSEMTFALMKIAASGGEPAIFTRKYCETPHYSPDGKFISCVLEGIKFAILSAEDGSLVKTFVPVQTPYLNCGAKWSPDSRELIYIVRDKDKSNIWRQPIADGEATQMTNFRSGSIYNFTHSPDGSRLYLARGHETQDLVLIYNFR